VSDMAQAAGKSGISRARRLRVLLVLIIVLLMVGGAVGGYLFGLNLTYRDLASTKEQLELVRPETQRLKRAIVEQNAKIVGLQADLTKVQNALQEIVPAKDTYVIHPNQSLIVANGLLTIGLVGPPTNESITVNVNGKQQLVAPGDIIRVTPNGSTPCRVAIQSFDMFEARVNVSCGAEKPQ